MMQHISNAQDINGKSAVCKEYNRTFQTNTKCKQEFEVLNLVIYIPESV